MKSIKFFVAMTIVSSTGCMLHGMDPGNGGNGGLANLPQAPSSSLLSKAVVAECILVPLMYAGIIGLGGRYLTEYNTKFTREFWLNFLSSPLPQPLKKVITTLFSPFMVPLSDSLSTEEKNEIIEMIVALDEKMKLNISELYLLQEPTTSMRCDSITVDTFAFSPDFFTDYSEEEKLLNVAYLCATIKDNPLKSDHHNVTHAAFVSAVVGFIFALSFSKMLKENISYIKDSPLNECIALPGLCTFITTTLFMRYARHKAAQSYKDAVVATDFVDEMVNVLRKEARQRPKTIIDSLKLFASSWLHTFFSSQPSAQELLNELLIWQEKHC